MNPLPATAMALIMLGYRLGLADIRGVDGG